MKTVKYKYKMILKPTTVKAVRSVHTGLQGEVWMETEENYHVVINEGHFFLLPKGDAEIVERRRRRHYPTENNAFIPRETLP